MPRRGEGRWRSNGPSRQPFRWSTSSDRVPQKARQTGASVALDGGFAFPRSTNHATLDALARQVTGKRLGMSVRDQYAGGANIADGAKQCRPVRVIGKHQTAVDISLTLRAAHSHRARSKRVRKLAEPAHPRRAASEQRRENELAGGRRAAWTFDER